MARLGSWACGSTHRHPRQPRRWADAEEIVDEYPSLSFDDIRAAIAYAADLAREEVILPLTGS